jgi:hypothetical protein
MKSKHAGIPLSPTQTVAPAACVGFILIGLLPDLTKMGYTVGRGL